MRIEVQFKIQEVLARFANSFDVKDWSGLEACFTESLYTDYSDLRGTPPENISASEYANSLTAEELDQNRNDLPNPRWVVLLHIINHGTDHRATVLQKLHEFGAPTFDQDLIMWLWSRK